MSDWKHCPQCGAPLWEEVVKQRPDEQEQKDKAALQAWLDGRPLDPGMLTQDWSKWSNAASCLLLKLVEEK